MTTVAERQELIPRVLDDPPSVHSRASSGVWSTSESAYELMAEHVEPGTRTLETGLGVSTVLFAAWGAEHTCVVHSQAEVDGVRKHMDKLGISDERVTFQVGSSDRVLPALELPPLDLVFIDGSHAFPLPILDWYFAASALRRGGLLLLDDTNLVSVRMGLAAFLEKDPRWSVVAKTSKWRAYERQSQGSLLDAQEDQSFLGSNALSSVARVMPEPVRPVARWVARRFGLG